MIVPHKTTAKSLECPVAVKFHILHDHMGLLVFVSQPLLPRKYLVMPPSSKSLRDCPQISRPSRLRACTRQQAVSVLPPSHSAVTELVLVGPLGHFVSSQWGSRPTEAATGSALRWSPQFSLPWPIGRLSGAGRRENSGGPCWSLITDRARDFHPKLDEATCGTPRCGKGKKRGGVYWSRDRASSMISAW